MIWSHLARRDIEGIFIAIFILGGVFLVWVMIPDMGKKTNWGFGPDWECSNPGNGDPVRVKRPAKTQ
jgi:hypothetical protein